MKKLILILFICIIVAGCSGILTIKIDNVNTLTPVFRFYQCNHCNEARKVTLGYLGVYYRDKNDNFVYVWQIKEKEEQESLSMLSLKYGKLPNGYETMTRAKTLEWNKEYEIESTASDLNDESRTGGSGSFILSR